MALILRLSRKIGAHRDRRCAQVVDEAAWPTGSAWTSTRRARPRTADRRANSWPRAPITAWMHWLAIRVALGLGKGELLLLRCDNVNLEGSVLPKPLRLDRPGSNPAPGLYVDGRHDDRAAQSEPLPSMS